MSRGDLFWSKTTSKTSYLNYYYASCLIALVVEIPDIVDGVVMAGTVELFVVVAGAVEFVVDAGQTVPVNCVWIHPTAVETRANPPRCKVFICIQFIRI